MTRILASGLSNDNKKDPHAVWILTEEQVEATVKVHFFVHRLEFAHMGQKAEVNITDFVSRLRETATKCKFQYFTKLAKAGYWSVKLAPSSQELTTFRTPFGRYC